MPEFDWAVDVLGEWVEDGDVYAVEGTDLVGADGLRIVKGVVEPPPVERAAVEPLRFDVGDTVFREHSGHPELVVVLRGAWIPEGPDGADLGIRGHVAQSVTARSVREAGTAGGAQQLVRR